MTGDDEGYLSVLTTANRLARDPIRVFESTMVISEQLAIPIGPGYWKKKGWSSAEEFLILHFGDML